MTGCTALFPHPCAGAACEYGLALDTINEAERSLLRNPPKKSKGIRRMSMRRAQPTPVRLPIVTVPESTLMDAENPNFISLYHVTLTDYLPSIRKEGIRPLKPSNWVHAASGKRYGNGEIFAFETPMDANRWAAKMDWELNRETGTGRISIVKFETDIRRWALDNGDPVTQVMYEGRWRKYLGGIAPEAIQEVRPFLVADAQALAKATLTKVNAEPAPAPVADFVAAPGNLASAEAALRFVLAGNAYFTVRSLRTGTRYTYRVNKADCSRCKKSECNCFLTPSYFVALLTGPDNTGDYSYLGMIRDNVFRLTRASKMTDESKPVRAFRWTIERIMRGEMPPETEIWHEGRCGRCGRKLTVPESVAAGIGPECAGRMGL